VITSTAMSPRMGPLALGYVRREVEAPGPVRVGGADGPEATFEALDSEPLSSSASAGPGGVPTDPE